MVHLLTAIEQWVTKNPQQPCIIEVETGQSLTYTQFLSSIYALRSHVGSTPKTIALTLPGGIVSATVWLSALSGGHTLIPLSPDSTAQEKAHIGQHYQPDMLIVEQETDARDFRCPDATILTRQQCESFIQQGEPDAYNSVFGIPGRQGEPDAHKGCHYMLTRGFQHVVAPLVGVRPDISRIWTDTQIPPDVQITHVEGCVILHTSGSTGKPKGMRVYESQIAWVAQHISTNHNLTPQDRGLTALPFFHVNAPVVSLCASLMAGSTVVIAHRFSRSHFWAWVEHYKITWASIVPTILAILLDTEKPAFLPGTLRFVRTASAPLPASQMQAFEAKFGVPVIETYGLSEAASQVTANPVPPGIRKAGSVGLPVGVSLRICQPLNQGSSQQSREQGDAAWMDVEPGTTGEICFCGPGIITGYLGNADARSFHDGWFRTGDLGYRDSDGYLYITGRLREVINRGGENIAPREIEEVLLTHPLVRDVAVVGRPDPIYGEVVIAYVVIQGNANTETQHRLHRYAAERLSPAKVPVDYVIVTALPHTNSGKVARQALREQESHRG